MAADTHAREPVVITSMHVVRDRVTARLVDAAYTTTREFVDGLGQGRAAVAIVVRDGTDPARMRRTSKVLNSRRPVPGVIGMFGYVRQSS